MNVVICDDNPVFAEQLYHAVQDYCARKDWTCACTCYRQSAALLHVDFMSVHVLFLDIDMPGINGLDLAHLLRKKYPELIIVFVTGFIEYAPAGYDVGAFRYLLKPELKEKLPQCLDAIWDKLYVNQESIRIQQLDHVMRVRLKDILYFEGTPQRHILLHTLSSSAPQECIGKLSDYETQLAGKDFLRIQKSFLVNMWHIEDIRNYNALLDNGESLKVSTANYSKVREQYILWEGQRL